MEEFLNLYFAAAVSWIYAVILIPLAIPLMKRKIKRNWWYGFRTKLTMMHDDIWYPVNEMSGRHMIVIGVIMAVYGLICFFLVRNMTAQIIAIGLSLVILFGGLIYSLIAGTRMGKAIAKEKGLTAEKS